MSGGAGFPRERTGSWRCCPTHIGHLRSRWPSFRHSWGSCHDRAPPNDGVFIVRRYCCHVHISRARSQKSANSFCRTCLDWAATRSKVYLNRMPIFTAVGKHYPLPKFNFLPIRLLRRYRSRDTTNKSNESKLTYNGVATARRSGGRGPFEVDSFHVEPPPPRCRSPCSHTTLLM